MNLNTITGLSSLSKPIYTERVTIVSMCLKSSWSSCHVCQASSRWPKSRECYVAACRDGLLTRLQTHNITTHLGGHSTIWSNCELQRKLHFISLASNTVPHERIVSVC